MSRQKKVEDSGVVQWVRISEWEKAKADSQFDFRANSVNLWEEKALSLKEASEKIYTNLVDIHKKIENDLENTDESLYTLYVGLASVWMLSSGYAVEALIKGLIMLVSSDVQIIVQDKKTGEKKLNVNDLFGGKTHDLRYLSRRVKPSENKPEFIDEEKLFMAKMASFTRWRGKYPIPLEATELAYSGLGIEQEIIELITENPGKYHEYVDVDKDKKAFDNVFSKILDKLLEAKKIKNAI